MAEKLVADALASGEWKEKVDVNRGNRKYYVNTKTKKSVWDLAKELSGAAGGTQEKPVAKEKPKEESQLDHLREDRLQKARRRAEAEAQINVAISNLERQKVDLETEIARLQGPLEQEAATIAQLKREVEDARGSMQTVAKDTMQRRRERNAELQQIRARVQKIESTKENELQHLAAVKERHLRLQAEAHELRQDLLKEQSTAESLRSAVRESQLKLQGAEAELNHMKTQIQLKEQAVMEAEQEVVSICKKRAEAEAHTEQLQREMSDLRARLVKKQKAMSLFGVPSSPMLQAAGGAAATTSMEVLAVLAQRVQSKKRALHDLSKSADREFDVSALQHQNARLMHLVNDAKRDAEVLQRMAAVLSHESKRTALVMTDYKAKCLELKAKIGSLSHSNARGGT
jgi:chromosome segregation ATPase